MLQGCLERWQSFCDVRCSWSGFSVACDTLQLKPTGMATYFVLSIMMVLFISVLVKLSGRRLDRAQTPFLSIGDHCSTSRYPLSPARAVVSL